MLNDTIGIEGKSQLGYEICKQEEISLINYRAMAIHPKIGDLNLPSFKLEC